MQERYGRFRTEDRRFALVVSRTNELITRQLLAGAIDCLRQHGASDEQVEVYWVPGAWELAPLVARLARGDRYAAIVALGALIRGATPHFDYLSGAASSRLANVATHSDTYVSFGLLTADTGVAPDTGNDLGFVAVQHFPRQFGVGEDRPRHCDEICATLVNDPLRYIQGMDGAGCDDRDLHGTFYFGGIVHEWGLAEIHRRHPAFHRAVGAGRSVQNIDPGGFEIYGDPAIVRRLIATGHQVVTVHSNAEQTVFADTRADP